MPWDCRIMLATEHLCLYPSNPRRRLSMASSSSRTPGEKALIVELGKHLRSLREAAGLITQAALAARLNVSHHYVSKCEIDKLVPSEKVFQAWLDICGASVEARRYITDIWVIASTMRGVIPQFARP